MMKGLAKGHNHEMSQESTQPWHVFFLLWPLLNQPLSCAFREGPKWLISSEILLVPHKNPLKGIRKSSTYSGWEQWTKARFKSFLNPFPLIISFVLISYYTATRGKTRKSAFEEEGLLCALRHFMSQPRALVTFKERWKIGFDAWHRASRESHTEFQTFLGIFTDFES